MTLYAIGEEWAVVWTYYKTLLGSDLSRVPSMFFFLFYRPTKGCASIMLSLKSAIASANSSGALLGFENINATNLAAMPPNDYL